MSEAITVNSPAKHAVENDPHQGGNKAAPRAGAGKSIVDHHMVDKVDHSKHHSAAKSAMSEHGHSNMTYHDGGER